MDVVTAAKLWLVVKPVKRIREARERRKARRRGVELSSEMVEYEVSDMSLREKIGNLRTSTKAGAAGLVPMIIMALPFASEAEALIQQACQSENGAVPFLVGGAVVWVVSYITARKSKTPPNPGVI